VRPAPSPLASSHPRPSLYDSLDPPAGFRTRAAATDKLATTTLRTEGLLLGVAGARRVERGRIASTLAAHGGD
jgi:hypothetical protein